MIRRAVIEDFAACSAITNELSLKPDQLNRYQYRVNIQKQGFLVPVPLIQEKFVERLKNIFLVYEHQDKVVGFIRIDQEQQTGREDHVDWFQSRFKKIYYSEPHRSIGKIAISFHSGHKGVGTKLLDEAIKKIRLSNASYLFSFVIFSPITNIPSIMFHEKNNFTRVAISISRRLYGMDNFRSILYTKKL